MDIHRLRRTGMRTRKNAELPDDVIPDILLRLPERPLLRFKCVCKVWYDLITSPDFIARHNNARSSNKNDNFNGAISLFIDSYCTTGTPKTTTVSLRFSDSAVSYCFSDNVPMVPRALERVDIVGCAHGLICLSLDTRCTNFILWNPATRVSRQFHDVVDELKLRAFGGFCFDPVRSTFKVARIVFSGNTAHIRMLALSASDSSWMEKTINLSDQNGNMNVESARVVTCVTTRMYWNILDCSGYQHILYFDMVAEVFGKIKYPRFDHNPLVVKLAPYKDGSVALFARHYARDSIPVGFSCSPNCYIDVWVLNGGYGPSKESWNKLPALIPSYGEKKTLRKKGKALGIGPKFFLYVESFASVY